MEIFNQMVLMLAIILLSTAAGWILEKSGVMAIGIESIMTVSTFSFLAFYNVLGANTTAFIFAIILAIIIGGMTNVLLQLMMTFLRANQALITLGFNIVLPILLFLISLKATPNGYGFAIPDMLPMIIGGYNFLFITFFAISIISIGVLSFFVLKTKFGLIVNAIGENPYVVQSSGKNIYLEKIKIAFISGTFAALAGVFIAFFWTVWTNGGYYNGLPAAVGIGYISLGIVILSKWKFKRYLYTVVVMGILIGLFYNFLYIWSGNVGVIIFLRAIPYILPMFILPFISKNNEMPKQLGVNFSKNKRE